MAHQAQHEPGRATVADDPYDNAFAESLWIGPPSGRLKAELLEGGAFLSTEDAHTEIFDYIEPGRRAAYYNRIRKHSSLGYKSPEQFEQEYFINLTNSVCR